MKFLSVCYLVSLVLVLRLPATAQTDISAKEATSQVAKKEVQNDTALHDELVAMSIDDQRVRKNAGAGFSKEEIAEMKRVNEVHEKRMREIIAQHGWSGKSLVGSDGSSKAWLIVQHCNSGFQEECLPLLERAVTAGEATGKNYAIF